MRTKKLSVFVAIFAVAFFAIFSFQSCQTTPKSIDPTELEGYWILKSINGQDAKTLFDKSLPTIQFDFKEMNIFGTGGCNRYNGMFTYENGIFNAPNIVSTQMLCMGKNEEGMFWVELARPSSLSIKNGILTFAADGKEATLEFEKGEAPKTFNEQLAGTWTLKIMEQKPISEIFTGENAKTPTLTFNFDEGKVNGVAGCNNFFTTFKIEDGLLIVSPIATTQMMCPNLKGETEYIKNLSDTSAIVLSNQSNLQIIKKGIIVLEYTKSEK